MLFSGIDNHKAGLGTMAELIAPNQKGQPGHEGYLRPDVASLAEMLGAGGYRTLFSSKWHLGVAPGQDPHDRGFQRSFAPRIGRCRRPARTSRNIKAATIQVRRVARAAAQATGSNFDLLCDPRSKHGVFTQRGQILMVPLHFSFGHKGRGVNAVI